LSPASGHEQTFEKPDVFKLVGSDHGFSWRKSMLSSILLTIVLLALSVHESEAIDY
jgi:hypothetical protein